MTLAERVEWLKSCTDKQRRGYYGEVAELNCLICGASAAVHHCVGNKFPAKRPHRPVVPLCYNHHQGQGGIHDGKESFEQYYGTQESLLAITEARLDVKKTSQHA